MDFTKTTNPTILKSTLAVSLKRKCYIYNIIAIAKYVILLIA